MTYTLITAHNLTFSIDTMDWKSGHDDRQLAEDRLEALIGSWTKDEAAEIHGLMLQAIQGDVEWSHSVLEKVEEQCNEIACAIFDTWASYPDRGYNCTISAEA